MIAYQREALKLVESLGLEIVDQWLNAGHLHMRLKAPDGEVLPFQFYSAWYEGRNRHNAIADLTRFSKAHQLPAELANTTLAQAMRKAKANAPMKYVKVSQPPKEAPTMANPPAPISSQMKSGAQPSPQTEGRKLNRLKAPEMFKLTKWVEGLAEESIKGTYLGIAQVAEKELGFPVSDSSVKTALESCGRKLTVPKAESMPSRVLALEERVKKLSEMVMKLEARVYGG